MASMKDVAKKAGVGMGTVSRVINGSGPVKPETKEKVLNVIKELDYIPNEMARSFKKQETKLVGVMVPMINHPFFAELTYYIEDELFKRGYKLMLCSSSTDREKEIEYLQMLKKNQVDGIITISYHDIYQNEAIDLPIVTIDRYISDNIPLVTADNYAGGVIASEKLIQAGCKKLGYVGGEPRYRSTVSDRKRGFIEVAKKHGIPYIIFEATEPITDGTIIIKHHEESLAEEFVQLYPDVDGVFASSDNYATAIKNEFEKIGKRVPEDIKVIGFDGIPSIVKNNVVLSTIKQPVDRMGRISAKLLIDIINGKEVEMHSVLPVEYIDGDTC